MPTKRSLVVVLAFGLLAALAPLPPAAASTDYRQTVDITFPTDPRATFIDDYAAGRSGGRVHRATDLMGSKMWPVYAAVGGTITFIPGAAGEPQPSYGYMITVAGDDGRTYNYIHLNDDTPGTGDGRGGPGHAYAAGLRKGSRVQRGQHIGYLGDSGNARTTPPHLHFEIIDPRVRDPHGSSRVNPYASLRAALARGDVGGETARAVAAALPPADNVDRVSGGNRLETAVALSKEVFSRADAVVVASGASFPDSIVAGPLAAAVGGPVLTTYGASLESAVAEEVRRLGARSAFIVGGTARVGAQVEADLAARGVQVRRLAGADQATTAAVVADEVRRRTGTTDALVALGSHPEPGRAWPDALSAGYHGAVTGQPVLLVDHAGVPAPTRDALAGVGTATIVGGAAAVSPQTAAAVDATAGSVRRLAGRDRFATSGAVADDLIQRGRVSRSRVWAATGHNYADALSAAGALAASKEAFVLIDGSDRGGDEGLAGWFAGHKAHMDRGRAIGGTGAVSAPAANRLGHRIR